MSYAKVGLDGLAVPAKIQYLRRLATALNGNPNFPTPNPSEAAVTAAADALETAYNEAQAARLVSKSKTSVQDEQNVAADLLVAQLASYVDNVSNGDATIIESAGFAVRSTSTPVGELTAPTDVQVLPSEHAGTADVSWKAQRGAKAFVVQRAVESPNLDWKILGGCTKKSASFNTMVSGEKYWFRIAAIGAAGQSAWSDPVPLFAP